MDNVPRVGDNLDDFDRQPHPAIGLRVAGQHDGLQPFGGPAEQGEDALLARAAGTHQRVV